MYTPELTVAEANETCLTEGDDLHIHCRLQYDENEPVYPRSIYVLLGNGTMLADVVQHSSRLEFDRKRLT